MKNLILLISAAVALVFAGCASEPEVAHVHYPVTYQVQVGNTKAVSDYGPQNLKTEATQRVTVEPGLPLYYHVESPFEVLVTVAESPTPDMKHEVSNMSGSSFTTSITPQTPTIEVTFSAAHPNTGGILKFTLSDKPISE